VVEHFESNKWMDLYDPKKKTKICSFLNMVILKKFKEHKFVEYIGTQCSITHLMMYYNKMAKVHDEKLLLYFFYESLSGITFSWYIRLDNTKVRI
jgi:hypothetical protein